MSPTAPLPIRRWRSAELRYPILKRLADLDASPIEMRRTSARQAMSSTSLIQGSDLKTSARLRGHRRHHGTLQSELLPDFRLDAHQVLVRVLQGELDDLQVTGLFREPLHFLPGKGDPLRDLLLGHLLLVVQPGDARDDVFFGLLVRDILSAPAIFHGACGSAGFTTPFFNMTFA